MTIAQDIVTVRDNVGEPNDTGGWTDARITGIIEAFGGSGTANLDLVSARIWSIKASDYSTLVNISENGSSRNLGDLFKNAQARASYFNALGEVAVIPAANRPRTRPIVRP